MTTGGSLNWRSLGGEMNQLIATARGALVQVENGRFGHGAGTIWHSDGLILTNAHVIAPPHHRRRGQAPAPTVVLPDGRRLAARVVACDPDCDLAALAVEGDGLPAIALASSRAVTVGQWVVAVGHPWGIRGAASAGVVIAVGPPPELPHFHGDLIQVGLQLRPGHSGGPMLDDQGRLVGINTMIAGPQVGLAIPIQTAKRFLKQSLN